MRSKKVNTKEEVSKKGTTAVENVSEVKKTKAKGTGRTTKSTAAKTEKAPAKKTKAKNVETAEQTIQAEKVTPAKEKKPAPADKPVNAFNTFTKASKMMAEVNNPNFKLPSNKQKREDLKKLCLEMKEYADMCLEKLGE